MNGLDGYLPLLRLCETPYISLDVETTGKSHDSDAVVEIAALRIESGKVVDRFVTLVNPGRPIPSEASAVHHITERDVRGAPAFEEIQLELDDFVENLPVIAHNAAFDAGFVPVLDDRQWLCSLRAARHLWPGAPLHALQYLRYMLSLDATALDGIAAHRAEGDAIVCGLLFHVELLAYERLNPGATMADFAQFISGPAPVTRFPYGRKHRGKTIAEIPIQYLAWVLRDAAAPEKDRRLRLDPDTLAAVERRLREERPRAA